MSAPAAITIDDGDRTIAIRRPDDTKARLLIATPLMEHFHPWTIEREAEPGTSLYDGLTALYFEMTAWYFNSTAVAERLLYELFCALDPIQQLTIDGGADTLHGAWEARLRGEDDAPDHETLKAMRARFEEGVVAARAVLDKLEAEYPADATDQ